MTESEQLIKSFLILFQWNLVVKSGYFTDLFTEQMLLTFWGHNPQYLAFGEVKVGYTCVIIAFQQK